MLCSISFPFFLPGYCGSQGNTNNTDVASFLAKSHETLFFAARALLECKSVEECYLCGGIIITAKKVGTTKTSSIMAMFYLVLVFGGAVVTYKTSLFLLSLLGFTAKGIVAGSFAAWVQANLGPPPPHLPLLASAVVDIQDAGYITAGSIFSLLQSLAAAKLGMNGKAFLAVVSLGFALGVMLLCKLKRIPRV